MPMLREKVTDVHVLVVASQPIVKIGRTVKALQANRLFSLL